MATLRAFLDARRVTSTAWNLTGMGRDWIGKYSVAPEDYDTFLSLHTAFVASGGASTLLERHRPEGGPILIDLDFRYSEPLASGAFSLEDVQRFVDGYASALRELTGFGGPLRAFVMLKPPPEAGLGLKDGIHIIWPDVTVPYDVQFAVREAVLERGMVTSCFGNACGVPADIFDKSVVKSNNWFLYGATKPNSNAAYRVVDCLVSVAGSSGVSHSPWKESDGELTRLFSLQQGREKLTPGVDALLAPIPAKKSPRATAPMTTSSVTTASTIFSSVSASDSIITHVCDSEAVNDSRLEPLLLKIPATRWDTYADWLTIGMVLFNEGCSVELWDKMSRTADTTGKYSPGECAKKWASFRRDADRKLTSRTLMSWIPTADGPDILINDLYACRKFVTLIGDDARKEGSDVFVFDYVTGLWNSDKDSLRKLFQRHSSSLVFKTIGEDGKRKTVDYGGPTRRMYDMFAHLPALLPNENFITKNVETSLDYLLFADGIFHIPTRTFTEGFDKTKVFLTSIDRPFPRERNAALEAEVNRRLFVEPFQNAAVGQYLKTRMARAIAGCYRDKKFLCALGEADSSKGTLTTALRHAFGSYVTEWNANYLMYNGRIGTDEGRRLSWLLKLRAARLAISNECRMDGTAIDGNLVKAIASGGDAMTMRGVFKDEIEWIVRTSFVFMGNDMPEITPKDTGIQTRVRMVRFNKRFVERPTLPNELPADPTIKAKLATTEWANAVFWVVMDGYTETVEEPPEVLEETKEWVQPEAAAFREVLEEAFVIDMTSTVADNYATAREIINHIKGAGLNLSDTKIGLELGKLGLIKIQKKISGRNIKVYNGIKSL